MDDLPRIRLGLLPTPLVATPRLGAELGVPRLWLKRDDCIGLAFGGSKVRALEYTLAEALRNHADTIVTHGGAQSNHACLTAAAAARLGLRSILYLTGAKPGPERGNRMLSRLCGAETVAVPDENPFLLQRLIQRRIETLKEDGRRPYLLPLGGAVPVGLIGYVQAVAELAQQLRAAEVRPGAIVLAAGSTGTLAGVLLGVRRFLPGVQVWGISIGPNQTLGRRRCCQLVQQTASLANIDWQPESAAIPLFDDWVGPGYGEPTPQAEEVIRQAAQSEGLFFDPIYTGKALAAVGDLASRGELRPEQTVIFWHTGGLPALFAHDRRSAGESLALAGTSNEASSENEVTT